MERFVLRNKLTGHFFNPTGAVDTENAIDGLIFAEQAIPKLLSEIKTGYELCVVNFVISDVEPVKVK